MKSLNTEGIILSRTNFGEADRIITVLTPDHGKLRLMAKGVRKVKSKLAGGIELFSISEISYISGKGDMGTLISSRLKTHYGNIVKEMDRVQLGYDFLKIINKVTEDHLEPAYFVLMSQLLMALNDLAIDNILIKTWFEAQLLSVNGHTPNLFTDTEGDKLEAEQSYNFDFDQMSFALSPKGTIRANQIKLLRLLFSESKATDFKNILDLSESLDKVSKLIEPMIDDHLSQARILPK